MMEATAQKLGRILRGVLIAPTPNDLWQLQSELLARGDEAARKAREVAGEFHRFLRDLESKCASRDASRLGAMFQTASVTSVGLQEMVAEQQSRVRRLLASGVTALLEIAGTVKNVEAWQVEASLVYYEVAWYIYGELWDISLAARPEMSPEERTSITDSLLNPVVDPDVDGAMKSALLIRLFQIALAARMEPLLAVSASDAPS